MRGKHIYILIAAFLFMATFTACNEDEEALKEEVVVKPDLSTVNEQTVVEPGEEPEKEDTSQNKSDFIIPTEGVRPLAVMIDNEGTRSLPQGGLDKAQVIYEIIVEGGETRLMPVFWGSAPQMIGPVRSSRHYFLDYVMEHDAIYIHFGWSPRAQSEIPKFNINNINGVGKGGEVFWDITNDKRNWQDSYTSEKRLSECIKRLKYRTDSSKEHVFKYADSETELTDGKNAEKINISYSSSYKCGYTYDPEKREYLRFRKGKPQMERVSGKQLTAKNIIVQYAANSRIKGDTKDRQNLDNIGSGKGWYITCGKAVEIKWSKASRTAKTIYSYMDGTPLSLNPGQTWVQIVQKNSTVIE